jgi:hypothetical protein
LITDRRPFCDSFGVGAAAREPSPKKIVESSHFVNCAASLIVKGRTLTVTEIEEAPSEEAILLVPLEERAQTNAEEHYLYDRIHIEEMWSDVSL